MIQLVDNRGLLLMLKLLLIRLEPVPTGVRCLYTYYLISLLKLPYKKNIIIFILAFLLALIIKRKIIAGKIKLCKIYNLCYFLLLYCIQILVIIFPSSHVSFCLFVSISFSLSHTQNYFLRLNVPEGRHISMRFF